MANVTSQARATSAASYTPADAIVPPFSLGSAGDATCKATFGNGTAADKVDLIHRKTYTLAAAATAINLYDGSLFDPQGIACPFRRVRRIRWKIKSATDGQTLTLGYATTTANAWTAFLSNPGTLTLQAASATNDGWLEIVAPNTTGMAVTTTSKLFNMNPGASTYNVILEIDGCSV